MAYCCWMPTWTSSLSAAVNMPQYDTGDGGSGRTAAAGGRGAAGKAEEDKIPLFLVKLWNIVEDVNYAAVICWDDSGYSFHITDPYTFCKNVLPQYFKHNNLNSLIRQLNMYGFRKITPIERSGLTRADSDHEHLEFSHPYFVRDHPELLNNIKRKSTTPARAATTVLDNNSTISIQPKDLSRILDEVRQLRERQSSMEGKMTQLMKENQALWQEVSHMRTMHIKQQQIVNKLVQFLVALVQPSGQKRLGKRQLLAIGPDEIAQGIKRARQSAGASALFSSSGGSSSNNVSIDLLDRLQRELLDDNNSQSTAHGPIIAEVTDDADQQGPSSVRSPQQLIGENVTLGSREPPLSPNPFSPAPVSAPQSSGDWNVARPAQSSPSPFNVDIAQVLGADLNSAARQTSVNSAGTDVQTLSTPSTLHMSPHLDRQLSQDMTDYLSGIDQGLENCRELMSNGGLQIDAETMRDLFSMCEQAPLDEDLQASSVPYNITSGGPIGNEVAVYHQRPQYPLPGMEAFNPSMTAAVNGDSSFGFVESPMFSVIEPQTPRDTPGPAVSMPGSTLQTPELQTPPHSPLCATAIAPLSTATKARATKGRRK